MTVFVTSDTHFHHARIIDYCQRPFSDVDEMNEELVRRWNSAVKEDDVVFHLGDFSFGKLAQVKRVVAQLNGYKILILGNHDRDATVMRRSGFDEVHENLYLRHCGVDLFMTHFPVCPDLKSDLVLCGHVHERWKTARLQGTPAVNVGVDQWRFTPQEMQVIVSAGLNT